MSVRIMTAVWSLRLSDSEKIVLLALADCANDEGLCWPSMATLAAKCSKSDRTVQAAIKGLVDGGHMSRTEVAGKGCRYIIHPSPEAASPPKPLLPRKDFAPEAASPPKRTTPTPEAASDKPSRTITSPEASPPSKRGRAERGSRLPEDWKPLRFEDGTCAREIIDRRGQDWGRRARETFENHWRAATGRNAVKSDWQRAFANWIIEQDNRDGRHSGTGQRLGGAGVSASGHGRTVDAAQRVLARRGLDRPSAE